MNKLANYQSIFIPMVYISNYGDRNIIGWRYFYTPFPEKVICQVFVESEKKIYIIMLTDKKDEYILFETT